MHAECPDTSHGDFFVQNFYSAPILFENVEFPSYVFAQEDSLHAESHALSTALCEQYVE